MKLIKYYYEAIAIRPQKLLTLHLLNQKYLYGGIFHFALYEHENDRHVCELPYNQRDSYADVDLTFVPIELPSGSLMVNMAHRYLSDRVLYLQDVHPYPQENSKTICPNAHKRKYLFAHNAYKHDLFLFGILPSLKAMLSTKGEFWTVRAFLFSYYNANIAKASS